MLKADVFQYLKPTDAQLKDMDALREAAGQYLAHINLYLPDGPDKTYIVRKLREVAMWVNVAVTRYSDGMPRQ